jgi:hypothetical protein
MSRYDSKKNVRVIFLSASNTAETLGEGYGNPEAKGGFGVAGRAGTLVNAGRLPVPRVIAPCDSHFVIH